MAAQLEDLILEYEGSVKRVWRPQSVDDELWFEYTDDYSVFDWGKMPDTIKNKGRALTIMAALFFEHLADPATWQRLPGSPHLRAFDSAWLAERWNHDLYKQLLVKDGAPHHCLGITGGDGQPLPALAAASKRGPVFLRVRPAAVFRPEPYKLITQTVFHYLRRFPHTPCRLIPLEVVFRFGMPPGSSLKARIDSDPSYAEKLGLESMPAEGELFSHPVIEFFTKLEPRDRLLTVQEALLISALTPDRFALMIELTFAAALALFELCALKGLELWDGKFEFLETEDGIILADSIGPDEVRLIYKRHNLSKEMIRQFYRGSAWQAALKEAQAIAHKAGRLDWKQICQTQLKAEPEHLPPDLKKVVDQLYGALTNHIFGQPLFKDHPGLDDFVAAIPERPRGQ